MRETESLVIPKKLILEELELADIDQDLGFEIIKKLNDFYIELKKEKDKLAKAK